MASIMSIILPFIIPDIPLLESVLLANVTGTAIIRAATAKDDTVSMIFFFIVNSPFSGFIYNLNKKSCSIFEQFLMKK